MQANLHFPTLPDMDRRVEATTRFSIRHPIAITIGCCLAWPLATELVRLISGSNEFYGLPFALAAVVFASWAGGIRAGLAVTIFSVALLSISLPDMRVINAQTESFWHLVEFSIVAMAVAGFQSALRRFDDRIRIENESKDQFLGIVSHELRTPLTVIHGGLRLLILRADNLSESDKAGLVVDMEEESERLWRTVEDLLTLARVDDRGKELEPLMMLRSVRAAIATYRRANPDRQIEERMSTGDCVVQGQFSYVEAVLRNLLNNADKYTPKGRPIVVTGLRYNGEVLISVRDFGKGVDDDQLQSIFNPYYRAASPTAADSRGLGLGLTLCRRAVEAMHGRIWARRAPGGGLEVLFSLPVVEGVA